MDAAEKSRLTALSPLDGRYAAKVDALRDHFSEFALIRPGQAIFTYFHFAASRELTEAMLKSGSTSIAYETLADDQGRLPLLTPMSWRWLGIL